VRRKVRKYVLFLVSVLFIGGLILGEEIALTPSNKEMKASIKEPLTFTFSLPKVKKAHLYFLVRAEFNKPGGYSDALCIELNGVKIKEKKRLINKPFYFKMKGEPQRILPWFEKGTWRVPISSDYTSLDKHFHYAIEGVKAHEFVLEITDLVKEENTLKFIRVPRPWSKIPLFFKNVKIIYEPVGEGKSELIKKKEITVKEKEIFSFFLAKEDKIPAEETKVWSLPIRRENQEILLKITCRLDSHTLGGHGPYLQLSVNGKPLDAYKNRREKRLLNKSLSFVSNRGKEKFWNLGEGIWRVFFSPDFKTDVSRYGVFKEPYTYLLDITDLLKEEGSNYLTATNLFSRARERQYNDKFPIIISLEVITSPEKKKEILSERSLNLKGKPTVSLLPKGGFEVEFENVSFLFESKFSYPGGGFNQLGKESSPTQEKEWQVKGKKISSHQWQVKGRGKYYSILRKITLFPNHIRIEDKIENLSSEEIGIIFSNHLCFEDLPILYCRMGGRTGQTFNNLNSPENPTLFFPFKNSGLGIVANDDVYRNQGILFYDLKGKTSGIKDEMFALDKNASYTISWSIYFVSSADYYDFINLVRRDWGSNNITVEGPVYFVNHRSIAGSTDEGLKKLIGEKKAKYIVFWGLTTKEIVSKYGKKVIIRGPGIFDPIFKEEIEILRKAIAKIRRVAPDVKIGYHIHSFFISPEQPDDPKFKDSWITDKNGKRAISQYSTGPYALCLPFQPVYPTLTNSYGKAYDKVIDFYLNDLGVDWLYWDEINGPGILGENRLTYNAWDGHTAKINLKTKKIEKKCAILSLICNEYIMSVADKVRRKGGFLLFNGPATTKARLSFPSFTEIHDLILRCYETHLNTPLVYHTSGTPSMEQLRKALNYGTIYIRTSLNYKSNIVTKFYPFTPEELHSGWVKGKERVITSKSGTFGWAGDFKAKLYIFDKRGELLNPNPQVRDYKDEAEIKVPEGGIAILERVDIY